MERLSADTVLLFSGLDPSGAAGIAADIETITKKSIQNHPKRLCKKVPFFFKKINKPRVIASIAKIE